MTGPRSHNRPPNKFRGTSLIVAAVVTTLVVALGVGTASASIRKGGHHGFGTAQGWHKGGKGGKGGQTASASASATDTASADPSATDSASADPSATDSASTDPGSATPTAVATGPVASDFIDIRQVGQKRAIGTQAGGSSGSFSEQCGNSDHQNSDNVIVAPGVTNGAHHLHDYVGNKTTSGASTDDSLAASGSTCNTGDQSAFYWPVVRDLTKGTNPQKRVAGELDADLNVGLTLLPKVKIQFLGNPTSKVVAMPKFLRILSGDAKSLTDGGANQHAQYTCTGFGNRISTTKYTLCPGGRGFTRISEFPSCWDGQNIDSANHRTHVVFPDPNTGACAAGFKAIPKLQITLTYNVPQGPNFAVDGFPEELHAPINDHNDFINVASDQLENQIVSAINSGKKA